MNKIIFSSPVPISSEHELIDFNCSEPTLDNWLKKRALKNQASGASRCFVTCTDGKIAGYYTLSAGAICHAESPKKFTRNMPDPLPILLIGRLAVDKKYHNQGIGSALLRDAMIRSVAVSKDTGIFAILVHAISEQAKKYYLSRGFIESPIQSMTLIMTLKTIKSILSFSGSEDR